MAEVDGQEKTEQPSEKKIKETREKGSVAKSMEINSFAIFLAGTTAVYVTKGMIGNSISEFAITIFSSLNSLTITSDSLSEYALKGILFFFSVLAPILIVLVIVSLAASIGQVGFKFSLKPMAPKFTRMNPLTGIKNKFFSSHSFIEVFKALIKLTIVGLFAYWILQDIIDETVSLAGLTIAELFSYMIETAFRLIWKITLVYMIFAGIDFGYQKYKHKQEIMMTKQEQKEEMRNSEGDPFVKSKIKSKQMMMARSRMMQDVPKADVVITNPTHFAVALKYNAGSKYAPKVLAKGADAVAQRIKQIAKEHGVPLHEDVELARALFKSCEVGDEIPANLFKAVAQVLAYIFNLRNSRKKKSIV